MMHGCNLHVMIGMQAMSLKVLSSVTIWYYYVVRMIDCLSIAVY